MPAQSESFDVAVVGGGAIGLACAWRAQQRGARVVVIDAGEPGAWHVAAGMLAPVSEAEFGERELLALGMESARRYAAFCAELDDPGYRATGTMVVARDRDEAEALDRLAAFRRELGLPVERLPPSQARAPRAGARADDPARARHRGRPRDRPAQARRGARLRVHRASSAVGACAVCGSKATGSPACGSPTVRRSPPARSSSPPACTSRTSSCPTTRAFRSGPVKGQVLRLRDPARSRTRGAHDPRRVRVLRPPRRRPLRARRDDGGARLGHDAHRRRRLRAAARHERARPGRLRARDRGADRRPASRHARQPARRSAAARSTV